MFTCTCVCPTLHAWNGCSPKIYACTVTFACALEIALETAFESALEIAFKIALCVCLCLLQVGRSLGIGNSAQAVELLYMKKSCLEHQVLMGADFTRCRKLLALRLSGGS